MIRLFDFIDGLLGRFFAAVKASTYVSTEAIACFRVFFGFLLLVYFLPSWSWISDVPDAFYQPRILSFAFLTDNYLPQTVYLIADILVIILTLCVILGFYTRTAFISLFFFFSIFYSYTYGFGKIDHVTTFLPFTCLLLAFTNSGTLLALRKDKTLPQSIQDRSIGILGIIIAFGFLSAGLSKLVNWVDFDLNTNGFLFWYYINYFDVTELTFLKPYVPQIPDYLLELMDYTAVLVEVSGFLFLLKGKRWWIFYLTLLCFFHLSNILLLNIDFTTTILTYGVMLIAPFLLFLYNKKKLFFTSYAKYLVGLAILITLLKIVFVFLDGSLNSWQLEGYTKDLINIALWCVAIGSGIFILRKSTKKVKSL